MRKTEKSERDDNDRSRNRNQKGETTGVFRPEQIEQTNDENCRGSEFFRMRNTEILKSGKCANRRRHQIIGDEEKRADDGDYFRAMPHAGVDSAAVRI